MRWRAVTAMLAGMSPGAAEAIGAGPVTLGPLLGRPASTVGKVLRRLGHSRRPRAPRPPDVRYERASPGELLHLDTKKLGRFWHVGKRIYRDGIQRSPRAGWQHVHVAVDAHSRLTNDEVRPSDRQADARAFLDHTLAWFRVHGVPVQAVMTDNGSTYRSHAWRRYCATHHGRHRSTGPYSPQTNGTAERLIQILRQTWVYAFAHPLSAHRTRALVSWLLWCSRRRSHGRLAGLAPVSRVSQLCGQYS